MKNIGKKLTLTLLALGALGYSFETAAMGQYFKTAGKALKHVGKAAYLAFPTAVYLYKLHKGKEELSTLEKPSQEVEQWARTQIKDLGFDDAKFTIRLSPSENSEINDDGAAMGMGNTLIIGKCLATEITDTLQHDTNGEDLKKNRMIIAHEMGHAKEHHVLKKNALNCITDQMFWLYLAKQNYSFGKSISKAITYICLLQILQLQYSKSHERNADNFALSKARDSEDLRAFRDFFKLPKNNDMITTNGSTTTINVNPNHNYFFNILFSDHPTHQERRKTIEKYAKEKFNEDI